MTADSGAPVEAAVATDTVLTPPDGTVTLLFVPEIVITDPLILKL